MEANPIWLVSSEQEWLVKRNTPTQRGWVSRQARSGDPLQVNQSVPNVTSSLQNPGESLGPAMLLSALKELALLTLTSGTGKP